MACASKPMHVVVLSIVDGPYAVSFVAMPCVCCHVRVTQYCVLVLVVVCNGIWPAAASTLKFKSVRKVCSQCFTCGRGAMAGYLHASAHFLSFCLRVFPCCGLTRSLYCITFTMQARFGTGGSAHGHVSAPSDILRPAKVVTKERKGDATAWKREPAHTQSNPGTSASTVDGCTCLRRNVFPATILVAIYAHPLLWQESRNVLQPVH